MKIQTRLFWNISRAAVSAPVRLSSRRSQRKGAIWLIPIAILALLTSAQTAQAVIVTSGQVDPSDPTTWISGHGGTTAYIGKTSTGSIEVNGGSTISAHIGYLGHVIGSTGIATVDGIGSKWSNSDDLYIGNYGDGTLSITGGGEVGNSSSYSDSYVGFGSDSTGIVTVHGPGSKWTNSDILHVGYAGNGTLNITGGGEVISTSSFSDSFVGRLSGSTGIVTVDGLGSKWTNPDDLNIGHEGKGTLSITNGGEVVVNDSGSIGFSSSSTGTATVDGAGSKLTVSNFLSVGGSGNGTLNITSGGEVSSNFGSVSGNSGTSGIAMVDGSGSKWTVSVRLTVGGYGNGTLNITNGGEVVCNDDGYIGKNSFNYTGTATVDGIGSKLSMSGDLDVGRFGNGILNITGGSEVSNSDGTIGRYKSSSGIVMVDGAGSKWTNASSLDVGNEGDGTLKISGGGVVSNSYGTISDSSRSTGIVTVDGAGSKWTNSRELTIGRAGKGTLEITNGGEVSSSSNSRGSNIGYYSSSTGIVIVDGPGSKWTISDLLNVGLEGSGTLEITGGGLVTVAGELTIDDNGGDDSFLNMSSGGMLAILGDVDDDLTQFLSIVDGTDAIRYWDGSQWDALTNATLGTDYTLDYYGSSHDISGFDANGYTVLTVGVVPEPNACLLAVIGLVGLSFRRRKSRRTGSQSSAVSVVLSSDQ